MVLSPWIVGTVGAIGKFLYPTDPKTVYETGAGPVVWTAPEGPLNIVEIEGVPIDYGNRGVTNIPFNANDMSLPAKDRNDAAAVDEQAKGLPHDYVYHKAFLKLYPNLHACVSDQIHGKVNPNGTQACLDFAERGDMSKLVFIQPDKDANPVINQIPKEIPQDAKSDLVKFLQYKEDTTYTLRDKAADFSQKLLNSFIGEGKESGKAVGSAVSGVVGGTVGGVATGFREGLDFRSFDEKLDPLINPNPGAPKISGSIVMLVGGGVLLLILLLRR